MKKNNLEKSTSHFLHLFMETAEIKHGPKWRKLIKPGVRKFASRHFSAYFNKSIDTEVLLFCGNKMRVILPEIVSSSVYTYGYFDEWVTLFLLDELYPGATFIDAGAHFGYCSMVASALVGETGKIVAIEPTPSTFEVLSSNGQRTSNTTMLHAALGREAGQAEITDFGLQYSAWNYMGGEHRATSLPGQTTAKKHPVTVMTIDQVVEKHKLAPNLIKIDTENYEEEVFAGMSATVERYRPSIILETKSEFSLRVGEKLLSNGYKPYVRANSYDVVVASGSWSEVNFNESNVLFRG